MLPFMHPFKPFHPTGNTLLAAIALAAGIATSPQAAAEEAPSALVFDADKYEARTLVVDGRSVAVRAYENIVYVARPVDPAYQAINIYIPEAYFHGGGIGRFSAETAPIFLPNQIGGYMPALPGTLEGRRGPPAGGAPGGTRPPRGAVPEGAPPAGPETEGRAGGRGGPGGEGPRTNTIAEALSRGYVVASPGARGRTSRDAAGTYTGKAPAAIVDLKAAVRYLRYNDARMPGDAEKIISNGTSAGGALSALLGASGNHADYAPHLQALGAAPARDDIFAVSAYCPITDLEHADSAYEWLFNGVNDYTKFDITMLDYQVQRKETAGTLDAAQIAVSDALKAQFPAYLDSLGLRDPQGQALTLDAAGNGSFKDYVQSLVIASAQTALDAGQDLSARSWLTIRNGKVTGIDFDAYVRDAGRQKLPPAFDALDLSSGENQLFGTGTIDKQHFTAYAQQHGTLAGASQADAETVKMMNPLSYIGAVGVATSTHWRIRHGTRDRDTSLAVPVILATTLQNKGHAVDLALPWDRPHSGDYDLEELFGWMERISVRP